MLLIDFLKENGISLFAIVLSLCALKQTSKYNTVNLESNYLDEIYKPYILTLLPEAQNKIGIVNQRIVGTDDLIDIVNNMRKSSIYYKYQDDGFYNELKDKLENIENLLVESGNMSYSDKSFTEFTSNLHKLIKEIYYMIHQKYIGKKSYISKFMSLVLNNKKNVIIVALSLIVLLLILLLLILLVNITEAKPSLFFNSHIFIINYL